ncbi:hypothetical protein CR969_01350 [Candidatus Saccharibacteria bacterium]|nr:MAG: hypothetical protein CR969_01350 [Candidatus Saccharibacteria bacterium]
MLTLILYQMYFVSSLAAVYIIIKLLMARKLRFKPSHIKVSQDELPTISVCIPARDETNSMTACLESVLASDYPKLEVLVLDDNSSDDTPNLIRAFAHAGVRFIAGSKLAGGWLGKNYALEKLSEEASGHYIVFLDVDTRIKHDTISLLIKQMLVENKEMVSILPQRDDMSRASTWFASLRYFWELALNSKSRPGAASAMWIINRHILIDQIGGFDHYRDIVQPERMMAKQLSKDGQYAFWASTKRLGVTFEKKWSSQLESSRRLLLPQFGNSFTNMAIGIGLIAVTVMPQIILVIALINGWSNHLWGAVIIGFSATIMSAIYTSLAWTKLWWLAPIASWYVAWQELFLLISSAIGYHFKTITWKGRPIERPARNR